jgi:transcriptional regulator with PAS, ATPase and Fis domain
VLIEAESGTGKELLARFIHDNSDRRGKPFVAVNCAAMPEHLLESELFGHVKGAFTGATVSKAGKFELAQGGTLLLDEIGEMPMNLQPKLLRALQEREFERLGDTRTTSVNIRVIATTNVNLYKMVEENRFRADLYYRLNVIPLSLPPLRERPHDIPVLAEFFATEFARQSERQVPKLQPEFVTCLQRQSWPGNVRELANFMKRVVALSDSSELGAEFLAAEQLEQKYAQTATWSRPPAVCVGTSMREVERQLLEETLAVTGGNRTRAAQMLGVSLRTIRNKIREYGLPPRRFV